MPADLLDLTAPTAPLAEVAARMTRLLPARSLQPTLAGVLLRAQPGALLLSASDGELSAQVRVPATVHAVGEVVVSRRGLADTLATLATHDVRLVVEGSRLALRTPGARFALPQLDAAVYPRPTDPPARAGTVAGAVLRAAAVPVAGAASRDDALPIFTGVRVRSRGDGLSLVATDRFRMAAASVPWKPAAGGAVDALVPGALLAEVAKQAGAAETVVVHADGHRFGLAWGGGTIVTASLATPFPDRQIDQLLDARVECAVEVDAEALTTAVHRAAPYAGPHGRVTLQISDGVLVLRGSDPVAGESEEIIKADVRGNHLTRCYQARFLLDALRPFVGRTARVEVQAGMRATVFTAPDPEDGIDVTYLVVPMRTDQTTG